MLSFTACLTPPVDWVARPGSSVHGGQHTGVIAMPSSRGSSCPGTACISCIRSRVLPAEPLGKACCCRATSVWLTPAPYVAHQAPCPGIPPGKNTGSVLPYCLLHEKWKGKGSRLSCPTLHPMDQSGSPIPGVLYGTLSVGCQLFHVNTVGFFTSSGSTYGSNHRSKNIWKNLHRFQKVKHPSAACR